MLAQANEAPTILSVVIPASIGILGGGLAMAWRLGALSTKVDNLTEQLRNNTSRLDTIEAKAEGARESAQAAVTAATAIARDHDRRDRPPDSPRFSNNT